MPTRVDSNVTVARPTFGQADTRATNRTSESARLEGQTEQRDRVEISEQARLRAEQTQPPTGESQTRGAAADSVSARPEAGDQGVNQATAQQAEQLRENRQESVSENARRPNERQGNLVDIVG
ncbi:MAG: hypothetical protein O3B73_18505 [bacterium]|nr:hypothetical protein [bacterium]